MLGGDNDPSKRAPMYWNAERNEGTTDLPPGCELPDQYPCGSLMEQKGDDLSVYNYYRRAIAIRKALPVISHGVPGVETGLNTGCVSAYRKTWGEETVIILMNIDEKAATVDVSGYEDWDLAVNLCVGEESVMMKEGSLQIPAWGVAVLRPAQ